MDKKSVLLQSTYLPPIVWISELKRADKVIIECCDHYQKQTYRTRSKILTGQGVMDLNVPVLRTGEKMAMKDVEISYKEDWQHLHWRALESSYGSSPFFEYYQDDFAPLYDNKLSSLLELNNRLLEVILEELNIKKDISYTEEYISRETAEAEGLLDLREAFSPKRENERESLIKPYYQVFAEKYGYVKGLSIVDLLFNMGPESVLYL